MRLLISELWVWVSCWAPLTEDFLSLMLCQWGVEARRKHRQDTRPKLGRGVFHTLLFMLCFYWAHHAQYVNCRELPRRPRALLGLGWVSVSGCWAIVFSPPVISLIIIVIGGSSSGFVLYLSYWTVLISRRGTYILSILPIPLGAGGEWTWGESERLHGSELPAGLKPRQM